MAATVVVIFDGQFGDRLASGLDGAIWVIGSATNLDAVERLRRNRPDFAVTTFRDAGGPPAEAFVRLLPTIDLHHGPYSQSPPYDRLDVYGVRPNHAVLHALDRFGFALAEPTADGFIARRGAPG